MKTPDKLYRFHVENLRAISDGRDHVLAGGRTAIALGNHAAVTTHVRLLAFLLGAWSECRLLKLLYEPHTFSEIQRAHVLSQTALDRWHSVIESAFRKHYGIPNKPLQPPALPSTAHFRYKLLSAVIDDDLQSVITMRNKLAHGQWKYPLNEDLNDVAQAQMDALRTENLLSLKQKGSLLEALCAAVHDLAVSKSTFDRDWDSHFRVVEQVRINIKRKSYDVWAATLKANYDRGRSGGELRGKLSGFREALLHLIARAGIGLSEQDRIRIDACMDAVTLDRWIENVLGAKTAGDILS